MKKIILFFLVILIAVPFAFAKEGSMSLLAVSASENGSYIGSIADLKLEIKEGSGRVFIDSFPLTKIDTQVTTRTAKQIACDYLDIDCSKYDFFYTMRSSAAIIGGPSGGAATTILTISLLGDIKISSDVAMTGTINSGNLVGSVSALREKISAAAGNGIKKVIIPYGERYTADEKNRTLDLFEYGKNMGVEVFEASDMDKALEIFTGKKLEKKQANFTINAVYLGTMSEIAGQLCSRSSDILSTVLKASYAGANKLGNMSVKLEEDAFNLSENAGEAMKRKEFYTAASYCYGSNVKYDQILMIEQNLSYDSIGKTMKKLENDTNKFESQIDNASINTITDLESYMIAKERILETRGSIDNFRNAEKNNTLEFTSYAAGAIERLQSARSWFDFYGKSGVKLLIDREALKQSCADKISEVEEAYQYVDLDFPGLLQDLKPNIEQAYKEQNSENYALCLFLASKAKAEIDAVSATIGVQNAKMDLLINQRLKAAEKIISQQNSRGIFPIFGYSYYEYSLNLKRANESKASALIYAQYAVELSRLDMYFKQKNPQSMIKIDYTMLRFGLIFLGGFIMGVVVYDLVMLKQKKKDKGKRQSQKNSRVSSIKGKS